jgi:hypothetical protein
MDPENHEFLMETSLPTPMTARVQLLIYQRVSMILPYNQWLIIDYDSMIW